MKNKAKLLILSGLFIFSLTNGYTREDDPDKDNHRETDRVFRDLQKETGASEHEKDAERDAWNLDKESKGKESQRQEKEYRGTCRPLERD